MKHLDNYKVELISDEELEDMLYAKLRSKNSLDDYIQELIKEGAGGVGKELNEYHRIETEFYALLELSRNRRILKFMREEIDRLYEESL